MKAVILLAGIVAVVAAQQDITITRSEFENLGESFNWASELSDGNKHEQSGQLKQIGEEKGISITGSYSYTSPEGQLITVSYIADENGFQPTGDHIPKANQGAAPAARPAAVRSLRPNAPRRG